MVPLIVISVVAGLGVIYAVRLFKRRMRRFDDGLIETFKPWAPLAIGATSALVFIAAPFVLFHAHMQTAERETETVTAKLVDDDQDGIYVAAGRGLFVWERYIEYTAADRDGWVDSWRTPFGASEIREGDALALVTKTVTAPASAFWPWDVEVERTYLFTAPKDAIAGIVPSDR